MILDEGEVNLEGFTINNVPFLIFEMADGAMYQAKMSGRNCVKIYQENN